MMCLPLVAELALRSAQRVSSKVVVERLTGAHYLRRRPAEDVTHQREESFGFRKLAAALYDVFGFV